MSNETPPEVSLEEFREFARRLLQCAADCNECVETLAKLGADSVPIKTDTLKLRIGQVEGAMRTFARITKNHENRIRADQLKYKSTVDKRKKKN